VVGIAEAVEQAASEWSEFVDPATMRQYAQGWRTRRHAAAENQVFQLVALDRFLRIWVPA
jgi:hypothetical protein